MADINLLSKEDVIKIHERLALDAENSSDPISPPGIKDEGLLESAIHRQHVGYGGKLKYDDPLSNAATLCYGVCCNHPLHNGNKRTALVSLLCHLDKNGLTFNGGVSQEELYSFMVKVAGHKLAVKKFAKKVSDKSDAEVLSMSEWIRKRTRKIQKGERSLSYSELEKVLKDHDVLFENTKGNYADLVKYWWVIKRKNIFKKESVWEGEKVANIPYFPGRTVGKLLVKSIRKQAGLTHEDGVDSAIFYGNETTPDDFIQRYRGTLNKLAKT